MEVKNLFLSCCRFEIGNGEKTRFWEDLWLSDSSLASKFPRLYAISNNHNITVGKVFKAGINSLSFRRNITDNKKVELAQLKMLCSSCVLTSEDDKLVWLLSASKQFSVKSFYSAMQDFGGGCHINFFGK